MVDHKLKPQDSSATPVVRWAVLVRIEPPPLPGEAQELLRALKRRWSQVAAEYLGLVARTAGIESRSLRFVDVERPRIGRDGKTPTIDFPRLRSTAEGVMPPFDTRVCIAVCTKALEQGTKQPSSKVWSRVGLPVDDETGRAVDLDRLATLIPRFRSISTTAARWGVEMLRGVLRATLPDRRLRRKSELEVSVLGTGDRRLAPYYERLSTEQVTQADELLQPKAIAALSPYFHPLVGSEHPLAEPPADDEDRFWFSYPSTVMLDDGELKRREVLYLMRASDEAAHALGVGFDDSSRHELPRRSALQVSRWIANRV